MTVDENLLAEAQGAEARVAELEVQYEVAKGEYRRVIRRMHLAGASMREIADALDISHQRVHQIIEGAAGPRRWRRRRADEAELGQLSCSFCGREQRQVRKLIAGPGVYICDHCIAEGATLSVRPAGRRAQRPLKEAELRALPQDCDLTCSFCGKRRSQVKALVAPRSTPDPPTAICSECLGLCQEIRDAEVK